MVDLAVLLVLLVEDFGNGFLEDGTAMLDWLRVNVLDEATEATEAALRINNRSLHSDKPSNEGGGTTYVS
jgi:hypothetical protein